MSARTRHRIRNTCLVALGGVAAVVIAAAAAWGIDRAVTRDRVVRNTTIAGRAAGGLHKPELVVLVAQVTDEYRSSPVVITAPGGGITTSARDLGLGIDRDATVKKALDAGRTGNVVARVWTWATTFVHPRRIAVQVKVDETAVRNLVAAKDTGPRASAT